VIARNKTSSLKAILNNTITGLKLIHKSYGGGCCCKGQNNESLCQNIALMKAAQNAFCNNFQRTAQFLCIQVENVYLHHYMEDTALRYIVTRTSSLAVNRIYRHVTRTSLLAVNRIYRHVTRTSLLAVNRIYRHVTCAFYVTTQYDEMFKWL
jgi:hypothetical protein